MIRRSAVAAWVVVATWVVVACAPDRAAPGVRVDDDSTAVVVTTSSVSTPPTPQTSPDPTPRSTMSATTPTTVTPAATTAITVAPVVGDPSVAIEPVGQFDRPIDVAVRAGDDSLYIVEQSGRVVRWSGEPAVVADVSDRISNSGEQGLLGLAFSPDGGLAYLDYTDRRGTTVIGEYPVVDGGMIDIAAERVILRVDQPFPNHNAGDLAFGPDGMLYITLGDGGSAGDPGRRASDPTSLLGSLLRIDPRPGADAPYTIPADNPFAEGAHDGVAGAPEVWAWGLRNPWKISFDQVTGALWIADVGQNRVEEVNMVEPDGGFPAGRAVNFGWSALEGTERYNTDVDDTGTVSPVLTYLHGADGCSISGGEPYRGTAIAELEPAYVYSDYCSGIVWALDLDGGRNLTLLDGLSNVAAVRAGPDAELYVLERGGTVYRLVPG